MHALARRAAAVTGKTQTSAIEEALLLLLREHGISPAREEQARRLDRVHRLLTQIDAELARTEPGYPSRVEDLYDAATGLPQ